MSLVIWADRAAGGAGDVDVGGWTVVASGTLAAPAADHQIPYAAVAGSWAVRDFGGPTKHWEIGIAPLPQWRGRGIGWRAQAMLSDYLFTHTPFQRIQAGTHPENIAEQKSLVKAEFRLEGVLRACEFRDGRGCDGYLYSRLRDDPSPL